VNRPSNVVQLRQPVECNVRPIPAEHLRAIFADRPFGVPIDLPDHFAELGRFDGPPRNVEVKPSLRFRAAVTVGLAIVSWGTIAVCYWLLASGAL
jgi:hypothetical protein